VPPGALFPRSPHASGASGRPRPLVEWRQEELRFPIHPLCRVLWQPGSDLRTLR